MSASRVCWELLKNKQGGDFRPNCKIVKIRAFFPLGRKTRLLLAFTTKTNTLKLYTHIPIYLYNEFIVCLWLFTCNLHVSWSGHTERLCCSCCWHPTSRLFQIFTIENKGIIQRGIGPTRFSIASQEIRHGWHLVQRWSTRDRFTQWHYAREKRCSTIDVLSEQIQWKISQCTNLIS